jgi:hypothetical protein
VNFDPYAFGQVCLYVIPIVIFFSIVFSAFLSSLASRSETWIHLTLILSYLFAFGIVMHELSHRLFCALFGVKVRETQLFKVTRWNTPEGQYLSVGGYVDCEDIQSVIVALFLGFAPLIINGLLVGLLVYYGPDLMATAYAPLIAYAGVALGLGTRTSKEDTLLWVGALRKSPGRGFLEIIGLMAFGGVLYYLVDTFQIPVWGGCSIFIAFVVIIAVLIRQKSTHGVKLQGI